MNFNKEQREGLARICDTLAVTAIVGAVVGATGHSPLQTIEIGVLIVISPVLIIVGYLFRRQK
jgi:ABC-type uncharacterized transport system ATPase subunit